MKYLKFLLLVCLLTCCKPSGEGGGDKIVPEKTEIKVMSFNIRSSSMSDTGENSWSARKEPCAKMIRSQAPDVIGFQEVHPDQRNFLISALQDYVFHFIPTNVSTNNGSTLLACRKDRFDLLNSGWFWLSPTPDKPSKPEWGAEDKSYRTCLWGLFREKESGREFFVFNTHLPYKAADDIPRTECVKLCLQRMKNAAGNKPVFFIGDMNAYTGTSARAACFTPLEGFMLNSRIKAPSTTSMASFNNFGKADSTSPTNQLDQIFYRNAVPMHFRVDDAKTYGVQYISDHWPVYGTFILLDSND